MKGGIGDMNFLQYQNFENLYELYDLTEEMIIERLSSEKLGEKLYTELQNFRKAMQWAEKAIQISKLSGKSSGHFGIIIYY